MTAVHIAYATDRKYPPWCAVAIRSCLDHATDDVTVHVLHEGDLDDDGGTEARAEMIEAAGANLELHRVEADRLAGLPSIGRFGTSSG